MSLWQIILACVFAWISGAFFHACVADGFIESSAERNDGSPFAEHAYAVGGWQWLRSPALIVQIGLLAAFLAAGVALILVST